MAAFLRHRMPYPCFGKPARDWRGGGASSIQGICRERDVLIREGGDEVGVEDFVRQVPVALCAGEKRQAQEPGGYLFQQRAPQHPLIDRLAGGRICSVRLVILLWPDGPHLHRVRWKLAVGRNITDQALPGSGNLNCSIDPGTGRVERVLQSVGPNGAEHYALGEGGVPVERHPDTQELISGVQLPNWEHTVALCLAAAAALPRVRYQSWDVVIGPVGPLFLEVNHHGAIAQVPGCKGFNDDEFRRFLSSVGKESDGVYRGR